VDGIFLFRPELNDLWDFRIFVHVEPEEALRRGVARDGPEKEPLYRRRYVSAQHAYLASVRPMELADFVFDNGDPSRPVVTRGAGERHP
jgi:uridine kinase